MKACCNKVTTFWWSSKKTPQNGAKGTEKKMSKTSQKGPTRKGPPRSSQRETPKRKTGMKETGKGILKASQKGLEYEVDTKHYERTKKQRLPPSIMKGIESKHWTTSWSQEGEQRCAQLQTFGMTRNVKRWRHEDKIKHHEGSTRIETPHL